MQKILIFIIMLILAGCKVHLNIPVKLSELQSAKNNQSSGIHSFVIAEVSSCKDRKTDLDSTSLLKAKQQINYIFGNAEFLVCDREGFKSHAKFRVAVALSADSSLPKYVTVSGKKGFGVTIGSEMVEKIIKNSNSTNSKFDLDINVKIDNDTNEDWNYVIYSSFVNDKPVIHGEFILGKGDSVKLSLSDVSVAAIKSGELTWIAFSK